MDSRRAVLAALLVAGSLVLAWQILVNTGSPTATDPASASGWAASFRQTDGFVRFGNGALDARDGAAETDAARAAAEAALRSSPLRDDALALLALQLDAEGSDEAALRVMTAAGRRSMRNETAQLWLFAHDLSRRSFQSAVGRADAVLRRSTDRRDLLTDAMIATAGDPEGRAALAAALGRQPPWRRWYLEQLSGREGAEGNLEELLLLMNAGPAPVSRTELAPYLDRLMKRGDYLQASLVWQTFLPADQVADRRYLSNGDFRYPFGDGVFDWRAPGGRNVEVRIQREGDLGRLKIQFGLGRASTRYVSRLLVLPPGEYVFTGSVETRDLQVKSGQLTWTMQCAEGKGQQLLAAPIANGTAPRTTFSVPFSVPDGGCTAQSLQFVASGAGKDVPVGGGMVFFDSLEINRKG